MADRRVDHRGNGHGVLGPTELLAAAQIIDPGLGNTDLVQGSTSWQDEAWRFYHSLGEFNNAVRWRASAISRMRLIAAEQVPDSNEPVPVDSGPAAVLVAELGGGKVRQPALLRTFSTLLDVPGESYLAVEEEEGTGRRHACAYSVDEIRPTGNRRRNRPDRPSWQVQVGPGAWRYLEPESLVGRIYEPDERYHYLADSPAQAALPIMREIDMTNRYIIATLLSRLAMNGMLLFPAEMTPVVPKQFKDLPDGFVRWLYDAASKAIKNPGTPSAAIPFVLKVPAQFIEAIRHITFATPFEEEVFEKRGKMIERLGTALNIQKERLTGMGEVNHWGQWQLAEDEIKINLAPTAEVICDGLTQVYLHPLLGADALSQEGNRFVVWYDATELTARPDLSRNAIELRRMHVITDEATRREAGFDEEDAPDDAELQHQLLVDQAVQPSLFPQIMGELFNLEIEAPSEPGTEIGGEPSALPEGGTEEEPEPAPPVPGEAQVIAGLRR